MLYLENKMVFNGAEQGNRPVDYLSLPLRCFGRLMQRYFFIQLIYQDILKALLLGFRSL